MSKLVQAWYQDSPWLVLLKPLSSLFRHQAEKRRAAYISGSKQIWQAPVPVIVVGNISVGGVGKTPMVVWLANLLKERGYSPGIVSRGYGSKAPNYPFDVTAEADVEATGDEPLLLARRSGCPVVIDANRVAASQYLLDKYGCDLIISDDGMQHYALGRDIEIAVVDGKRGLGNGQCLPAGPLREAPSRLESVDFVVINGEGFEYKQAHHMQIVPGSLINLNTKAELAPDALVENNLIHAVAGIGNPARYFTTLRSVGYRIQEHPFDDHHPFQVKDLQFNDEAPVIMTEKDAVKCAAISNKDCWYLSVQAQLPEEFADQLMQKLLSLGTKAAATP